MLKKYRLDSGVSRVEGAHLALRLVELRDADYIHGLRTNPDYNTNLSPVSGTGAGQRAWIERYKAREARKLEYYYLIERLRDGSPCGVVRLYEIGADRFTWGSWILDANKPRKAALESAVLSFGIGFENLAKETARIDVRRQNTKAIAFYRRFGMTEVGSDKRDVYFRYSAERYFADRAGHLEMVKEAQG